MDEKYEPLEQGDEISDKTEKKSEDGDNRFTVEEMVDR